MFSLLYGLTLISIHDYWKNIALTRQTFIGKLKSLLFNVLSRLVIAFLPWSKCLLDSCLCSPFVVILEPKKIKSVTFSIVPPSICHEVMGPDAMILVFWMLSFKPTFSLPSFTFIKRLFSSSFFHQGCVICIFEVIDISPKWFFSTQGYHEAPYSPSLAVNPTHGIQNLG